MSLPLNEILTTILREFEKANLSIDISREYWHNIYQSNSILKELPPSRVRLMDATISLPLAFESISNTTKVEAEFSKTMLRDILINFSEIENREEIVDFVFEELDKDMNKKISGKNLITNIEKLLTKKIVDKSILNRLNVDLKNIQRKYGKISYIDKEAKFLFQTDELEKISLDRIVKFEFKIGID